MVVEVVVEEVEEAVVVVALAARHLRQRLAERQDDLVQPLPRLHQPQHPQHPQHAQDAEEREVGAAAAREHRHPEVDRRQQHDRPVEEGGGGEPARGGGGGPARRRRGARVSGSGGSGAPVELVPAVLPVALAPQPHELQRHLDHKEDGDHGGRPLHLRRPFLRLAGVRAAHNHHVEDHERGRAIPKPVGGHDVGEGAPPPRRARRAVAAAARRAAAAALEQRRTRVAILRLGGGLGCTRLLGGHLGGAFLLRGRRHVHLLRLEELVEDDGEEQIDDEEAADHREHEEIGPRVRRHCRHRGVRRRKPRVEGHRLHDDDERPADVVERRDAVDGRLEVSAHLLVGAACASCDAGKGGGCERSGGMGGC